MKGFKRFTAIALSAAMIIGSCFTVMADNSIVGEEGKLEGYVNKKIFSVNVPTNDAESLKMIVDPQGLIKDTHAAAYADLDESAFESNATVFFKRSVLRGGETASMNHLSDTISSANIGTLSANVTYTAEITGAEGITFVSADSALSGNTPSMRVYFKDEASVEEDTNLMLDNSKVTGTVSTSVNALDKSYFSASYNALDGYTYKLTEATSSNAIANAAKAAFHFVAAANAEGDWSAVKSMKPKLTLTWKFEEKKDGEAAAVSLTTTYDSNDRMYKTTLPAAIADVSSITSFKVDGKTVDSSNYTLNSGKTIVRTTKDGLKAALGVTSLPESFTFTLVIDGKNYTSNVSRD